MKRFSSLVLCAMFLAGLSFVSGAGSARADTTAVSIEPPYWTFTGVSIVNAVGGQGYAQGGSIVDIGGSGLSKAEYIFLTYQGAVSGKTYNPQIIYQSDNDLRFVIPDYVPSGDYTIQVVARAGGPNQVLIISGAPNSFGSASPYTFTIHDPTIVVANSQNYNGTHPIGSFVNVGGAIYKITESGKFGFPTWNIFASYGGRSSEVVPGNSADANLAQISALPFADGSLVRYPDGLFYIWHGMRMLFASDQVFTQLGYSFSNVVTDSTISSGIENGAQIFNGSSAHLDGTLVKDLDGTVYLVQGGSLWGIPDPATFASYGYTFSKVVPMNAADQSTPKFTTIQIANGTIVRDSAKTIWLIEDGKKIGFSNYAIYQYLGYGPNSFIQANVDNYQPGQPL